jgi:hypothetical protein
VALVATGALAQVAALAVSLIGGGRETKHPAIPVGPVDAVAKARAALVVPPGQMLHMRIRMERGALGEGVDEVWAATDPPRWRHVSTSPQQTMTFAFGAGVSSYYDAKANRLRKITGYADDSPQAKLRTLLGVGNGSPDEDLRAALERGELVDAGEQQVDGRTGRRLESKDKDSPKTIIVLTYDVDPKTFAPVGGSRTYYLPPKKPGGPRRMVGKPSDSTFRFKVELYERVPIDEAQFAVKTNPKTKVSEVTKEQFARQIKAAERAQKRCSKLRAANPRARCPKITSP